MGSGASTPIEIKSKLAEIQSKLDEIQRNKDEIQRNKDELIKNMDILDNESTCAFKDYEEIMRQYEMSQVMGDTWTKVDACKLKIEACALKYGSYMLALLECDTQQVELENEYSLLIIDLSKSLSELVVAGSNK